MIFVYQSLNSGSQKVSPKDNEWGEKSTIGGMFTGKTQSYLPSKVFLPGISKQLPSSGGLFSSAMPISPGSGGIEIERFGTGEERPRDAGIVDNQDLVSRVVDALLTNLTGYGKPDVIVLGEVCLPKLGRKDYVVWQYIVASKACQAFTILIRTSTASSFSLAIDALGTGPEPSYPILTLTDFQNGYQLRIACVHIPNKFISGSDAATKCAGYLIDAQSKADIVLGDTNLANRDTVRRVGELLWGTVKSEFPRGFASESSLHPGSQGVGTNAKGDALFDRGISRFPGASFGDGLVDHSEGFQGPQLPYQFLGILCKQMDVGGKAVSFSDHNGMALAFAEPSLRWQRITQQVVVWEPGEVDATPKLQIPPFEFQPTLHHVKRLFEGFGRRLAALEENSIALTTSVSGIQLNDVLIKIYGAQTITDLKLTVGPPPLPPALTGFTHGKIRFFHEEDPCENRGTSIDQIAEYLESVSVLKRAREIILLERVNDWTNFGMGDLVVLAHLLQVDDDEDKFPDWLAESPIFHEAQLVKFNKLGVTILGVNPNPETAIAEIWQLLLWGYNINLATGGELFAMFYEDVVGPLPF